MKHLLLLLLILLFSFRTHALLHEEDSVKHSFIHNFNISAVWFEAGYYFPLEEKKLESLPGGMDKYFNSKTRGGSFGFFSFGLYYKDRFGAEAIYRHSDFKVNNDDYKKYITQKYPGYFIPAYLPSDYYTLEGIMYRLCYKHHFKHIMLEPKFQLGINDYESYTNGFILKEMGSNRFIEYNIEKVNRNKNNFSYHLMLNISKRFNPFKNVMKIETALKLEYMIAPTNYLYTITEKPYGMPATVQQFNVKQLHPAFGIELCVFFFFKKQEPQ